MEKIFMDYSNKLKLIQKDLQHQMSSYKKRLHHIEGVALRMQEFSNVYALDLTTSLLIAYLHDFTKKQDEHWHLTHMYQEHKLLFKDYPYYQHAASAYYVAKNVYKIEDHNILHAIVCHCTGHATLNIYAKLMIISDVCEPSRQYEDTHEIYELALIDYEKAYELALNLKFQGHLKEERNIHPWFKDAIRKIEEYHE